MQIQFKQAEIVVALKNYIVAQGININQKTVDISFSNTRGPTGMTAEVSIEDPNIPGFSDAVAEVTQPAAVPAAVVKLEEPVEETAATAEPELAIVKEEVLPKATSLFGN